MALDGSCGSSPARNHLTVSDFDCDTPTIWPIGNVWMPKCTSTVVILVGGSDGLQEVGGGEREQEGRGHS